MLMKLGLEKLAPLLHDAGRAMRKRFEQRTQDLGLSSAQWRLLVHLAREGRASQKHLADLLDIEPISVSRLLDRMAAADWVTRELDMSDRRVRMIVPTPKALQAYEQIRSIASEVYDEALAGLSGREREMLVVGLNTIVKNLSSPGMSHCPSADVEDAK